MAFNPYLAPSAPSAASAASPSGIAALARIHNRWIVIPAILLGMGIPSAHRWAVPEAGFSLWLLLPPSFIAFVTVIRPVYSTVVSTILTLVFCDRLFSIDVPWLYIGPPVDPDYQIVNCAVAISCSVVSIAAAMTYFVNPTLLPSWQKGSRSAATSAK